MANKRIEVETVKKVVHYEKYSVRGELKGWSI
jgi:hypothetical protein